MPIIRYYYEGVYFSTDELHRRRKTAVTTTLADSDAGEGEDQVITCELVTGSRLLGSGSFGKVYSAMAIATSVTYVGPALVVKVAKCASLSKLRSVRHEARFFEKVNGGPVAVGFNEEKKCSYFVCKKIRGQTLKQWFRSPHTTLLEVFKLLDAIFLALKEQLHDRGLFHGDLKPENIMVECHGGGCYTISFIDFGTSYTEKEGATYVCASGSYYHPSRVVPKELFDGEGVYVKPDPYQDIYSLCRYLCHHSSLRRHFQPFLSEFCIERASTIGQLRLVLRSCYVDGLRGEIFNIESEMTEDKRKHFFQIAALGDLEGIVAVFKEKFTGADYLTVDDVGMIDWPHIYKDSYETTLFLYCMANDNLMSAHTKTVNQLREWLPAYLNRASNELLEKAKKHVQGKIVQIVRSSLALPDVNRFTITVEELREKLPVNLQTLDDAQLVAVINESREKALSSLEQHLKSDQAEPFRVLLYVYGRDYFVAFLGALPEFEQLAPVLTHDECDALWSQVDSLLPMGDELSSHIATFTKEVAISLDRVRRVTKVDLGRVNSGMTIDEVRAKCEGCSNRMQAEVVVDGFRRFKAFCDKHKGYDGVAAYWQEQIEQLQRKEPAATYADWFEFKLRLQLSVLIVKGFWVYDQGSSSTRKTYRTFALAHPDEHTLSTLCQIVTKQVGWGSLQKHSFFICILNQQPKQDPDNPLMPLLQSGGLVECFKQDHYWGTGDRASSCLFKSPDKQSRSQILKAVANFAKQRRAAKVHPVRPMAS